MALSAMNKTSRTRREILKIEKSIPGGAVDPDAAAEPLCKDLLDDDGVLPVRWCLKFAL